MDTEEALRIVDEAAERSSKVRGTSEDVLEAMRCLRDAGVERDTLVWFWTALLGDNDIGRFQNANASRNRIRHLLDRQAKGSRGFRR